MYQGVGEDDEVSMGGKKRELSVQEELFRDLITSQENAGLLGKAYCENGKGETERWELNSG